MDETNGPSADSPALPDFPPFPTPSAIVDGVVMGVDGKVYCIATVVTGIWSGTLMMSPGAMKQVAERLMNLAIDGQRQAREQIVVPPDRRLIQP